MSYNLYLDDLRNPIDTYPEIIDFDFCVVRNYHEFVETILNLGVPNLISFDNDLGCDDLGVPLLEGYDCAKWLIFKSNLDLINLEVKVHSANPVAKENIQRLFYNYFKHLSVDTPKIKTEKFKNELIKASNELNSTRLVYEINFWFGAPSHSLRILDIDLFGKYDIQSGWNGIGEGDLIPLEQEGFLKKISEIVDENDPLEKIIEFEIILP